MKLWPFNAATRRVGISFACLLLTFSTGTQAADHQEAPNTRAQLSADIGDYYAWHDNGQLNLILTFGTFSPSGMPASYDADLLYSFHFDSDDTPDGESDIDLYVRFGQNTDGQWGLRLSDSSDATLVEGAVESILTSGQISLWSGLADDPFFFDQTGFVTTVGTGTLSFDPTRDDVAGLNVTAIVIQLPIDVVKAEGGSFQTWATSASL